MLLLGQNLETAHKMFSWISTNSHFQIFKIKYTYLRSLSSSPKLSKYTEPHKQARFPRITIIVDEFTAKYIAVPAPQVTEC